MRSAYPSPHDVPREPLPPTSRSLGGSPDLAPEPDQTEAEAAHEVLPPGPDGVRAEVSVTPVPPAGPPIEVNCFGGPRVMCSGQQVWPGRTGGDAKPWELLLYLACQPAEGVAIDEAVEALWPEDEEPDNAPHRFRQLRYRLRRMLASVPGAPETDGICLDRGTLRLDPGVVHSDAQEFLGLVRSPRLNPGLNPAPVYERARALFIGDLLDGPDARRYAWVDERDDSGVTLREHFRRLFQHASTKLAELYAGEGQSGAAIDLYRELTEIDPGDERLWCALFRVHAQRGDRPTLIREEQRMRQALRELSTDVDDADSGHVEDPSRETVEEYQRLLATVRAAEREAAVA